MGQVKHVLGRIGITLGVIAAAVLVVIIVLVGGYALYIWIAHPRSFPVPFTS